VVERGREAARASSTSPSRRSEPCRTVTRCRRSPADQRARASPSDAVQAGAGGKGGLPGWGGGVASGGCVVAAVSCDADTMAGNVQWTSSCQPSASPRPVPPARETERWCAAARSVLVGRGILRQPVNPSDVRTGTPQRLRCLIGRGGAPGAVCDERAPQDAPPRRPWPRERDRVPNERGDRLLHRLPADALRRRQRPFRPLSVSSASIHSPIKCTRPRRECTSTGSVCRHAAP
jgi:hypothetical protein